MTNDMKDVLHCGNLVVWTRKKATRKETIYYVNLKISKILNKGEH
jgi:hypothetical protein